MNRRNLEAWVRALVSEEYLQTTGLLAKPDDDAEKGARFCCLGVACDVSGRGSWVLSDTARSHDGMVYEVGDYRAELAMPDEVAVWLFGDAPVYASESDSFSDPTLQHPDGRTHAASAWNDRLGATFIDIANLIVHTYKLDPELIPEEHR